MHSPYKSVIYQYQILDLFITNGNKCSRIKSEYWKRFLKVLYILFTLLLCRFVHISFRPLTSYFSINFFLSIANERTKLWNFRWFSCLHSNNCLNWTWFLIGVFYLNPTHNLILHFSLLFVIIRIHFEWIHELPFI